jgi:hypothetical protein
VVNFGQVAVTSGKNAPQSGSAQTRMATADGKALQLAAKPFTEIAPKRSPVRVRLAPCQLPLITPVG